MAAVTQYSCINDADVAFSDEEPHGFKRQSCPILLKSPMKTTRSAESSGVTETGSKDEYAVKSDSLSVRFDY